jgi:hypothetical protein
MEDTVSQREPELYVSTDVETDGPIPGPYSMLSIGSVALRADKTLVSTFSANLETLRGASQDPRTMEWWQGFPQAWQRSREDPQAPEAVMQAYLSWLESLPGKPVFVGWPAAWDFMWVYWYLVRFTGKSPFGHKALDIRSYAMAVRRSTFRRTGKGYLPKRWFDDLPHTHVALDDAREQGALFCNMLVERLGTGD